MDNRQKAKIFVGGLSWETTDEKLRKYFENFGNVQDSYVSYDRANGRPRGFGFVVFEDEAVANRVVSLQHTIDRREVEAKKAVPKEDAHTQLLPRSTGQQKPTKKLFVGGLAASVDETAFRKYFEQFGPVDEAVVMYDHDNKRPRGFGFVSFFNEESVEAVFTSGVMQMLHDKPIEIKRAVPRDQMPIAPVAAGRGRAWQGMGRGGIGGRLPAYGMQQPGFLPQAPFGPPFGQYPSSMNPAAAALAAGLNPNMLGQMGGLGQLSGLLSQQNLAAQLRGNWPQQQQTQQQLGAQDLEGLSNLTQQLQQQALQQVQQQQQQSHGGGYGNEAHAQPPQSSTAAMHMPSDNILSVSAGARHGAVPAPHSAAMPAMAEHADPSVLSSSLSSGMAANMGQHGGTGASTPFASGAYSQLQPGEGKAGLASSYPSGGFGNNLFASAGSGHPNGRDTGVQAQAPHQQQHQQSSTQEGQQAEGQSTQISQQANSTGAQPNVGLLSQHFDRVFSNSFGRPAASAERPNW